jgi:hypothetical protein
MNFKSTILFFIMSYMIGISLHFFTNGSALIYIMGLFLYINVFTMFHPLIFQYGIMRPLQLSISSVGLLSMFTGDFAFMVFSIVAVLILVFIEKEDIYSLAVVPNEERKKISLTAKRMVATIFMPFSVTYGVLIFRPYEEITSLLIVFVYFAALFVSSKWFDSIISFGIFVLIQIFLFVYIIETYMQWNSFEITTFFVSILMFLLIGYTRKGILNNTSNNTVMS